MPTKTLTYEFSGEEDSINDSLQKFAIKHGWVSQIPDPDNALTMIANPTTYEDYAAEVFRLWVRDSILEENIIENVAVTKSAVEGAVNVGFDSMTFTATSQVT